MEPAVLGRRHAGEHLHVRRAAATRVGHHVEVVDREAAVDRDVEHAPRLAALVAVAELGLDEVQPQLVFSRQERDGVVEAPRACRPVGGVSARRPDLGQRCRDAAVVVRVGLPPVAQRVERPPAGAGQQPDARVDERGPEAGFPRPARRGGGRRPRREQDVAREQAAGRREREEDHRAEPGGRCGRGRFPRVRIRGRDDGVGRRGHRLEDRSVLSDRQADPDGRTVAVLPVEPRERVPQPVRRHPHDRVLVGIEVRRAAEQLHGDRRLLQLVIETRERPLADVREEPADRRRAAEGARAQHALQLCPRFGAVREGGHGGRVRLRLRHWPPILPRPQRVGGPPALRANFLPRRQLVVWHSGRGPQGSCRT